MPNSDYTAFGGGGALRLKGGKVGKPKKKRDKNKDGSDLEKALSVATGEGSKSKSLDDKVTEPENQRGGDDAIAKPKRSEKGGEAPGAGEEEEEEEEERLEGEYKTEAERRYEESQRKRVRVSLVPCLVPRGQVPCSTDQPNSTSYSSWPSHQAHGRNSLRRTRRESRSSTRIFPSLASITTCPKLVPAKAKPISSI
jgi:protein FAM32A